MNLKALRKQIDEIDQKLIRLLNDRIKTAREIGELKQDEPTGAYVPAREKEVLDGVAALNEGELSDVSLKSIYREIMSASLAVEKQTEVAYLGPPATFTHQAARSRFGASVEYLACETVADVFSEVEKGSADYGVVPIENSIHGPEAPTLDCLLSTPLKICAEIVSPISQCLLSRSDRDSITCIYSHPQGFAQCRGWLRSEMPGVEQKVTSSTGKAAELAASDERSGAIASRLAAELHDLRVLADNVQDESGNKTRFMILAKAYGQPTGEDKTSIIFSVKHEAGSLYSALEAFRQFELNMTKIESRPLKSRAWEYCFYVDFEGHAEDENVANAVEALSDHCTFVTVLGSYPKAC